MNQVVFFAFQGEKMCFTHLLINALDLHEKEAHVKIVIEGKATALIPELMEEKHPLFQKVMDLGLIDAVCRACSQQMGVLEYIEKETELPLNGSLMGHPPMEPYLKNGFQLITL